MLCISVFPDFGSMYLLRKKNTKTSVKFILSLYNGNMKNPENPINKLLHSLEQPTSEIAALLGIEEKEFETIRAKNPEILQRKIVPFLSLRWTPPPDISDNTSAQGKKDIQKSLLASDTTHQQKYYGSLMRDSNDVIVQKSFLTNDSPLLDIAHLQDGTPTTQHGSLLMTEFWQSFHLRIKNTREQLTKMRNALRPIDEIIESLYRFDKNPTTMGEFDQAIRVRKEKLAAALIGLGDAKKLTKKKKKLEQELGTIAEQELVFEFELHQKVLSHLKSFRPTSELLQSDELTHANRAVWFQNTHNLSKDQYNKVLKTGTIILMDIRGCKADRTTPLKLEEIGVALTFMDDYGNMLIAGNA